VSTLDISVRRDEWQKAFSPARREVVQSMMEGPWTGSRRG